MPLQYDPANANRGTERAAELLHTSLAERGAGEGILADAEGTIIAGNKTLRQAQELGMSIREVETDGTEWIVIKRTDQDLAEDASARMLAYEHNRIAELGLDWSPEQLAADRADGIDLEAFWFPDELDKLVATVDAAQTALAASQRATTGTMHYNIMFADFDAQRRFFDFLRRLKGRFPELETPSARLDLWLTETMGDALNGAS